jgi:membrane protease YdiL (CAAX protease family)
MQPGWIDYLLMFLLIAVVPVWAVVEYRRLLRSLQRGRREARLRAYWLTIVWEWLFSLGIVIHWMSSGRSLSELGLGVQPGPGWMVGNGLVLVGSVFFIAQTFVLLRDPERLVELKAQLEPVRPMLPHDDREAAWFNVLAVTAGICEELMYRGFLLTLLKSVLGAPAAVLISSIAFGFGHLYQGRSGVLKTGAIGLVMAGLTLLSGSIWGPMLLHAIVDLGSGTLGRVAIARYSEAAPMADEDDQSY